MVRIWRNRILSFSSCSADPGFGSGVAFTGWGLSGIRSGGSADSGGRGGSVFDSGKRSGAIWGSGVGAGEPSGTACSAGEGDDSAAPGRASCARNAPSNGAMPSDREKNRATINQEILARVRVLTLLFRLFLNKADYYILVGFATNRLFGREGKRKFCSRFGIWCRRSTRRKRKWEPNPPPPP